MNDPWLDIPADDYVGHMTSPEVRQYQVLNLLFRDVLMAVRPRAVLVLGCSIGNGFEHIDPAVTSRVAGVDINPAYLQRLAEDFPNPDFALELRCADLATFVFEPEAFDLVHAALVLEYLEWPRLLPRAVAALRPGGVLSVVLQRPSPASPAVTPTPFTTLRLLEPVFHFVDPNDLLEMTAASGLELESRQTVPLESGKAFEILRLRKPAA